MRQPIIIVALLVCPAFGVVRADDEYELQVPAGLKKVRIPGTIRSPKRRSNLASSSTSTIAFRSTTRSAAQSCHDPAKGWSNGTEFATGIDGQIGGRSSPTIINSAYSYFQFWDGRAQLLEGQALGPIANPIEMNMKVPDLIEKLNSIEGYRTQFKEVFGGKVTPDAIAKAIASFERTILSGDAPYDRFKAGDTKALSASAQRGMQLFFNKAKCSSCHSGSNFSDAAFHNIGVGMDNEKPDVGRYAVTRLEGDKGSFKTPTLREIARTAAYMHDGSQKTLRDVVEFYNKGGTKNPQLDEEIFPLNLSKQEVDDLVTFMQEGLSSVNYPMVKPPKLPD